MKFDLPRFDPKASFTNIRESMDTIGKESAAHFAEESKKIAKTYRRRAIIENTVIGVVGAAAIAGLLYITREN